MELTDWTEERPMPVGIEHVVAPGSNGLLKAFGRLLEHGAANGAPTTMDAIIVGVPSEAGDWACEVIREALDKVTKGPKVPPPDDGTDPTLQDLNAPYD